MVGHDAPRALEPVDNISPLIDDLTEVLATNVPLGIDGLREMLKDAVRELTRVRWLSSQVNEQRRIIGAMVREVQELHHAVREIEARVRG